MSNKDSPAPRVAIKFSASSASRPAPTSALGKRARPQLLHDDSDSDLEGDQPSGRQEPIAIISSTPHAGGTHHANHRRVGQPRVILRQSNRDWKSERETRAKYATVEDETAKVTQNASGGGSERNEQEPLKWGLTLKASSPDASETMTDSSAVAAARGSARSPVQSEAEGQPTDEDQAQKTADEDALDALLEAGSGKKKEYVIASKSSQNISEGEVFRRHLREAPAVSTLEEYEEMPVEEFGAALLRGMGWDGRHRGPKSKDYKRRPNHMGLGAKALNGQEDLGSWNQKSASMARPRLDDYKRMDREKRDKVHRNTYKQERDRDEYRGNE